MRLAHSALIAGGLLSLLPLATGCQNKMYDENKALRQQNIELQSRLAEKPAAPAPAPVLAPEPVKAPEPAPVVTRVAPPTPAPVAPPPAPVDNGLSGLDTTVDKVAGTTTVNFVGDALFDPGKAVLKDSAKANLTKVATALKKQYNGKPVKVQGYTDSDPIKHSKWTSNEELSKARADAVRSFLLTQGVESARVSSEGLGATKPKDPANTAAAKAKNRRVEIVVLDR